MDMFFIPNSSVKIEWQKPQGNPTSFTTSLTVNNQLFAIFPRARAIISSVYIVDRHRAIVIFNEYPKI